MNPEREQNKGGKHLQTKGEKTPKPPRKKLTARQKAIRAACLAAVLLTALAVGVFAVSRLLFVRPELPGTEGPRPTQSAAPEDTKPPEITGDEAPDLAAAGRKADYYTFLLVGRDTGGGGNTDTIMAPEDTKPPEITGDEAPDLAAAGRKADYYTFLLVGRDTGGGGNTDTIMVVSYDVAGQRLNAMSIPRDTIVNKSWDIKKINSVYNRAGGGEKGMAALMDTVADTIGFAPDFHIVVEWEAVGELAKAIGGVDFDVPVEMNYDDPTQDLHIHISKGYQHLDGEQVMQVLRFRKNNNGAPGIYNQGDIGRIQVQQDLLMAIADKLLRPSVVTHIPELVDIFMDNVETDLTIPNLLWLAKSAIQGGLRTDSVNFVTLPANYNGYFWSYSIGRNESYVFPYAGEIVELVNADFNPYLTDVNFVTLPANYNGYFWSYSIGRNESYVFPYAGEIVELVNADFNPYLTDVTRANLDVVYKNDDGSIAATGSAIRDSKANPAYYESLLPEETEPPETSQPPEETELPGATGAPEETGTPGETQTPGETEPPEETELPAETGTPDGTEPPSGGELPAETGTPVPSEAPETPEKTEETQPSPGDIGIPIFTPPAVPTQPAP